MGGPSKSLMQAQTQAAQTQTGIAQQELGLMQNYENLASQQLTKANQLQQPAINFATALASGSPTAGVAAAAPEIGNISTQAKQAEANIMNTVAPGAGRDYALAQVERGKSSDIASFINQAFMGGMNTLTQLGNEALGAGLQEQGATMSAAGGAASATGSSANIYGNVAQQQEQAKASTMSFLGQLAGAAASPFSFGFGPAGGGGGGAPQGGNVNAIPLWSPPAVNTLQYAT